MRSSPKWRVTREASSTLRTLVEDESRLPKTPQQPHSGERFVMKDLNSMQHGKQRKLTLKKNTIRVLNGAEAKAVVGGAMAAGCTDLCKTIVSTKCCPNPN